MIKNNFQCEVGFKTWNTRSFFNAEKSNYNIYQNSYHLLINIKRGYTEYIYCTHF